MPKKKVRRRGVTHSAERVLRDLQRSSPLPTQDLQNLRQPRLIRDARLQGDQTLETFTTYGAYQDPI